MISVKKEVKQKKNKKNINKNKKTKYEEIKKVDDNKAFNPVISQNLLDNSFDHKNETELESDKKEEENIFAYEQNSTNILNEENSLYKKEDDNKIDLSDGRLDSILGIKH